MVFYRGWQNKETSLTATRTTQYQPITADENFIDLIFEPREVSIFCTLSVLTLGLLNNVFSIRQLVQSPGISMGRRSRIGG
jgi:hypothetical protein